MIENAKISVFKSRYETTPVVEVELIDFYANVLNGDYAAEINAIRTSTDKDEQKKLKATLPAFTISGTFKPTRAMSNLAQHSGRICLDIDQNDNLDINDWPALRDTLGGLPEVEFAALSARGQGVFCVVPIAYPHKHRQQFQSLFLDFESMGLKLDLAPQAVSSLRYMTYDKDAVFNETATPYSKVFIEPTPKYRAPKVDDKDNLPKLIQLIKDRGVDITGEYTNWYEVGSAIANTYGEGGRAYFHAVSANYHKYSPRETDKKYDSLIHRCGNYGPGTLFHYSKIAGLTLKDK